MRTTGMRPIAFLHVALLSGLLLMLIGCRDEGEINPFEPTSLPNTFLNSFSSDPTMVGLGGQEASLEAYVVDGDGNPVAGVEVRFSADMGTVDQSAVTDSTGVARAVYRSGSDKGTATVSASVGSFELRVTILVGANELTVGQTSAIADGRTKVDVSARVYRFDGVPAIVVPVTFSTSAGTIPAAAMTDSSGYVSVQLTAPASAVDVQAEIQATVDAADLGTPSEGGVSGGMEIVGVAVVTFRGITLSLSSDDAEIVASGSDSTLVRCSVTETVRKVPAEGVQVSFGSSLGSITSSAYTDESGIATAILRSGIYPGTANVFSLVESLRDSTTVEFTPLQILPLKATPRKILAGGDEAVISTSLLNENNNPMPNLTVHFETSLGLIPATDVTDTQGKVAVPLTSSDSTGIATVHAWFGSLSVYVDVEIAEVISEPIRLTELQFDPPSLVANGASRSWVTTRLLNDSNNPVVGEVVDFATTLGVIGESAATDSEGVAGVWLTSLDTTDMVTAYVTAVHGSLTVGGNISFLPSEASTPTAITLRPAADHVQVAGLGGMESVVLTAVAYGESGEPIEDGWDVKFRLLSGPGGGEYLTWPDSGSGSTLVVPIVDSEAHATLTAGTKNGVIAIEAEITPGVKAATSVTVASGPAASATIAIDSLIGASSGGGTYTYVVAIGVRDAYSNPVSPGTPVYVTLHADSCGSGVPPAAIQINGSISTENNPTCSPGTPAPGVAYACMVAPYGDFVDFPSFAIEVRSYADTTLACVAIDHGGGDAEPASIALVSVSDSAISVAGVGGDEASLLQFEVRDEIGRPLRGNPTAVEFAIIASPGGGTSLSRLIDTTDANGRVSTTVQSGTVSGVVKVRASAGGIESKVVNLAIHGGPPDPEHFSIAAQRLNVEGLLRFGITDSVTAFVYDEYANPVPPGTAIYFTASHGGILGSAVTNTVGQATVVLYSAAPLPTCAEGGLVEVTARTVDGSDNTISANMNVLFSGNTVISSEPSTFAVENGGYQDLTIIVSDVCGNPLVAGTEIGVTSSAGVLVGNVEVTLPDTQSPGYTQFWVRLSDGDSNETDPPTGQSITVEVTSPNGNAGFVIFGTMD